MTGEEASEGSEGVGHICAGCGGRGLVGHAVATGDCRHSAQGAGAVLQVNAKLVQQCFINIIILIIHLPHRVKHILLSTQLL